MKDSQKSGILYDYSLIDVVLGINYFLIKFKDKFCIFMR